MFCPRCGSTQGDNLKFCKACGANLEAVRQVVDTRQPLTTTDRNMPWFAEMAIHDAESRRRQEELDHRRGIKPELNRYNEIKAGIITASGGVGITVFLFVLMQGIIAGGVSAEAAQILGRIWVVGVIPILVGLALLVNGIFVSKRLVELTRAAIDPARKHGEKETNPLKLSPMDSNDFIPTRMSVTEGTTRHLSETERDNSR
jgi:hypothetical protein